MSIDKHFTAPETISPFYGDSRIPRKLKKKVKGVVFIGMDLLTAKDSGII